MTMWEEERTCPKIQSAQLVITIRQNRQYLLVLNCFAFRSADERLLDKEIVNSWENIQSDIWFEKS